MITVHVLLLFITMEILPLPDWRIEKELLRLLFYSRVLRKSGPGWNWKAFK